MGAAKPELDITSTARIRVEAEEIIVEQSVIWR